MGDDVKAKLAGMFGGAPPKPAGAGDDEEPPPPEPYEIHTAGSAADVRDLIARKADINAKIDGCTPVFAAAMRKSDVCSELIKAGADFTTPNPEGVTPLQAACWAGVGQNAKLLVQAKAVVDEKTFVPTKPGVSLEYNVVEALIEAGVPSNIALTGVPTFHGIEGEDNPAGGVKILYSLPGQSAKRCGLQPGDVITAIDGQKVPNVADLNARLKKSQISDRWTVTFTRDGASTDKDLILGAVGYTWYSVDGVGILREKERILALKAEEEKEELARQMKLQSYEVILPQLEAVLKAGEKKGKVDAKAAVNALKKKLKTKFDTKSVISNWEDEEGHATLHEFALYVCEQLDEQNVDVPSLKGEL